MTLIALLVVVLAASHLVDVWFNGSIFADHRAFLQSKRYAPDSGPCRFCDLMACWYCLLHWAVLFAALLYWGGPLLGESAGAVCKFAVWCLAAIRLSVLINIALPKRVRFERAEHQGPDHRP